MNKSTKAFDKFLSQERALDDASASNMQEIRDNIVDDTLNKHFPLPQHDKVRGLMTRSKSGYRRSQQRIFRETGQQTVTACGADTDRTTQAILTLALSYNLPLAQAIERAAMELS